MRRIVTWWNRNWEQFRGMCTFGGLCHSGGVDDESFIGLNMTCEVTVTCDFVMLNFVLRQSGYHLWFLLCVDRFDSPMSIDFGISYNATCCALCNWDLNWVNASDDVKNILSCHGRATHSFRCGMQDAGINKGEKHAMIDVRGLASNAARFVKVHGPLLKEGVNVIKVLDCVPAIQWDVARSMKGTAMGLCLDSSGNKHACS